MKRLSLRLRLILAASLVLAGFLGLTGFTLYEAFRSSTEQALRDRLLGLIYSLLAAADEDEQDGIYLPGMLSDPRFNQPGSGFYAQVDGAGDGWRSMSMLGSGLDLSANLGAGELRYTQQPLPGGGTVMVASFGVVWETFDGTERAFTFSVAEDLETFMDQLEGFSRTLWGWLAALAGLLLVAQLLLLRWSLAPLDRMAIELRRVREGESDRLAGPYPRELHLLTSSLNSLLDHLRARETRYRNSMQDLAHSLKTPLAILRTAASSETDPERLRRGLDEQIERMNGIVRHQLGRSSGSGREIMIRPVELRTACIRIAKALEKVDAERRIAFEVDVPGDLRFHGDEGDLLEVLGNLLENARKYADSRARVQARASGAAVGAGGLEIDIEDDGPGIPPALRRIVRERGGRADQAHPGQGLGLSVVDDIVRAYRGRLEIGDSDLGGAKIRVSFPGS